MPDALLDRQVLFFGGKGGVGKTTLATAFAVRSADRRERTLLVSTDPAHSTADVLGTELGPEPLAVGPSLWAVEIDPSVEADRYIAEVKERIADVTAPRIAAEVERQIDIARLSPGAEESALFDRFTRLIDELGDSYDRVIFDTAPLGHTLRLLALPEQLGVWISGLIGRRRRINVLGRMWRSVAGAAAGDRVDRRDPVLQALVERQGRFERTRRLITDRRKAAFVFVMLPERLSILETQRAVSTLTRYHIPVGAVIVNRVSPDNGGDMRPPAERRYLEEIGASFAGHPIYHVPRQDTDIIGVDPVRRLAASIIRPTFGP